MNMNSKQSQNQSSPSSNPILFLIIFLGMGAIFFIGALTLAMDLQTGNLTMSLPVPIDQRISQAMATHDVTPLNLGAMPSENKVELGRALFFDKILSGNQDIACATCHHPNQFTADGIPLSIGTGGATIRDQRLRGVDRDFIPRHAPDLFNRGAPQWNTMFWDGRISMSDTYQLDTPASDILPEGLDSPLAAQAMFPVTSRAEMRGNSDDITARATHNEIAQIADSDLQAIWDALTARVVAIPDYQTLFAQAYPDVPLSEIGFEHIANALAAFEIAAFSFDDAPWDNYVSGDQAALTDEEKAGAELFFGEAQCATCHNGPLLTDQAFYNLGIPQLGPGKDTEGYDQGRYLETKDSNDRFAFRTPPLRNVALTAPYMHNGTVPTLDAAIRVHFGSQANLDGLVKTNVDVNLLPTYKRLLVEPVIASQLADYEIAQLVAFLNALTSPTAEQLPTQVPDSVPSKIPIDR